MDAAGNEETTMAKTTMRVWNFGAGGKLILGNVEVESMNHARALAAKWNQGGNINRIEIVANGPVVAQATAVTAVS